MDDPIACCEKCGVMPPASVCDNDQDVPPSTSEHDLRSPTQTTISKEDTIVSAALTFSDMLVDFQLFLKMFYLHNFVTKLPDFHLGLRLVHKISVVHEPSLLAI